MSAFAYFLAIITSFITREEAGRQPISAAKIYVLF